MNKDVSSKAWRQKIKAAAPLATASEQAALIAKFLKDSEHFFFRPVYRAMIKIMIAARSDRALARILNVVLDARQTLNGIWIDTLGAAATCRRLRSCQGGKHHFPFVARALLVPPIQWEGSANVTARFSGSLAARRRVSASTDISQSKFRSP